MFSKTFAFLVLTVALVAEFSSGTPVFSGGPASSYDELLNGHGLFGDEPEDKFIPSEEDAAILRKLQDVLEEPQYLEKLYNQYKEKFNKEQTPEDSTRKLVFQSKLVDIASHNLEARKGKHSWQKGINQFTDMTLAEFRQIYIKKQPETAKTEGTSEASPNFFSNISLPSSVNWNAKNKVGPVVNQGACGASVLYSGSVMLQSLHAIAHNKDVAELSSQELVDCSEPKRDICKNGIYYGHVLNYMQKNGLSLLSQYPVRNENKQGSCDAQGKPRAAYIAEWKDIAKGNDILKQSVVSGPVMSGITCPEPDYDNGIYNGSGCKSGKDEHSILVVGYGEEAGVPYWIIRNSWDSTWGEGGNMRLQINDNHPCGVGKFQATVAKAK